MTKHRYFRLGQETVLGLLDDRGRIWKAAVIAEMNRQAVALQVTDEGVRTLILGHPEVTDEIWESGG